MEYSKRTGKKVGQASPLVMLKRTEYKDPEGRKFLVDIPEGFDMEVEKGIFIGPPELDKLNLPLNLEVALNNQLYDRKLYTLADVRRRPEEIRASLMAILKLNVEAIKATYKEV